MKAPLRSAFLALLILFGLIAFTTCTYSVSENETVIITQFGKPLGQPVSTPGLHAKWPFVQAVNRIDRRIREWDGQAVAMPTRDKLYIIVDSFGRWRVK
jgi:membrane protease subunit HflC